MTMGIQSKKIPNMRDHGEDIERIKVIYQDEGRGCGAERSNQSLTDLSLSIDPDAMMFIVG